jgi:hypothetical protein
MSIIMKWTMRSMLCGAMILIAVHDLHASGKEVASGRSHGRTVSIVNDSGEFVAGSNDFCVAFTKTPNAAPVPVNDVSVDFTQQVGRIREKPTHTKVTEGNAGLFCGKVDLGAQYYRPAFYYVFIHYIDATGTRRKCRLSLVIKQE